MPEQDKAMNSELIGGLSQALDAAGMLVAGVRPNQWTAATPCADWTVRDLVNHMVGGNRVFAEVLSGTVLADAMSQVSKDALGDDPVAAYTASTRELVDAFSIPDVLHRTVTVPFGAVPGQVALHLRIVEALVHGWDLGVATDQQLDVAADLVEPELHFTRAALATIPSDRTPFGPPQPVAAEAAPIDRLAALLGRSPAAV
jgi:uncharacterized protein (TIGR03086 family)